MNRREFLNITMTAGVVAAGAGCGSLGSGGGQTTKGIRWSIGCFNRPWAGDKRNWGYDAALDGMKVAGYPVTGLLTRTDKEPLIGSDATPEYLAGLKQRIAARGLRVNMAALRVKEDSGVAEQSEDLRRQIENGKAMGAEFLLTFGVNKQEHFETYYKLMRQAAAQCEQSGMKLVLKPHGGASGAAEEITRCLEQVNHPNFKIWFDAGNIIYYTGKDPLEQLKPISEHVTGFCAKDCDKKGGSVWLQFGTGAVDFGGVFRELKRAGFNGPIMVECCELGDSPEIVTSNARKNREYLEGLFATL